MKDSNIKQHTRFKKVIFFTNIVAPYRVFLFNKLEEIRINTIFDFEVYFMRMSESNRNWNVNLENLNFKFSVGNGLYFDYKSLFIHFNPILIFRLVKSKEEIILGGSWNNPNVMLIALLKSFGLINNKLSIWSEANYLTNESQRKNKLRDYLKKWLFSKIDGSFIIPGEMAILSFEKWGIPIKNIIKFPNLVDYRLFSHSNGYLDNKDNLPIFFIVARLEENIKGVKNFIQSIGTENLKKIKLRIAGTGSSLQEYISFVKTNKLEENISFLGNLSQEEISNEYQNSNVFVLPSFSDPSPLTIVEAIYSGLPVFVSERCGNHFETVINGENGYTFDPYNSNDIREKFELLISQRDKWPIFSKKSLELAENNFNPEKVLTNFINMYLSK